MRPRSGRPSPTCSPRSERFPTPGSRRRRGAVAARRDHRSHRSPHGRVAALIAADPVADRTFERSSGVSARCSMRAPIGGARPLRSPAPQRARLASGRCRHGGLLVEVRHVGRRHVRPGVVHVLGSLARGHRRPRPVGSGRPDGRRPRPSTWQFVITSTSCGSGPATSAGTRPSATRRTWPGPCATSTNSSSAALTTDQGPALPHDDSLRNTSYPCNSFRRELRCPHRRPRNPNPARRFSAEYVSALATHSAENCTGRGGRRSGVSWRCRWSGSRRRRSRRSPCARSSRPTPTRRRIGRSRPMWR